jgi:hypothetical protein
VSITGARDDQLLLRKEMAESLAIEESRHEAVDEMYFWPAAREYVPGGDALADEAASQEREWKIILDELGKAGPEQPEFVTLLAAFARTGWEHIHFEGTRVWPRARMALSAKTAAELSAKIAESKPTALTRLNHHVLCTSRHRDRRAG